LIGDDRQLAQAARGARGRRHTPPAPGVRQRPPAGRAARVERRGAGPVDHGKRNVLGVLVDALDYDAAIERVMDAAR
jgi:hypothetical protein